MKSVLMAILVLTSSIALADSKANVAKVDSELDACLNSEAGQSNAGMKGCMADAWDKMDAILNNVYKQITADLKKKTGDKYTDGMNAEVLNRLVKSERAWIQFRDTNSSLHGYGMIGGTGESLEVVSKSYDMEKARVQELGELFGF